MAQLKFRVQHWLKALGLCLLLALGAFGIAGADGLSEDPPSRIIAIGDLHGDYDAYISILKKSGLIDKRKRWAGGDAVLVQTGDIADRGPDTRKIIEHMKKLQRQAEKDGGRVIALIGNHEAMNMTRDLRYVHPGEYKAFKTSKSKALRNAVYDANQTKIETFYRSTKPEMPADDIRDTWLASMPLGRIEHQQAWHPDGEIGAWILNNPVAAIVGDTLFVHGGLSASYRYQSLDELNQRAWAALREQTESETRIINDPNGPLWYRGLIPDKTESPVLDGTPDREAEFERVLKNHGVARVVIAHTPHRAGIITHYDDRLIRIDTGIADYYEGTESYLRIENGRIFAHDDERVREIGGGG